MSTDNMEILFRGFHPCEDGDTTIYVKGKAVKGRWVKGGYWLNDTVTRQTPHIIDDDGNSFNVIPATVCQYTGLTDKNSKRIFEGNTVLVNDYAVGSPYNNFVGRVINIECAYFIEPSDPKDSLLLYNECAEYEVLGTIWDKERQDERD